MAITMIVTEIESTWISIGDGARFRIHYRGTYVAAAGPLSDAPLRDKPV